MQASRGQHALGSSMKNSRLDQANSCCFGPPAALGDIEGDAVTFIEGREPGWRESRDVDEYVLSTITPSDEAEALVAIEPFHGAGHFDRCAGRWPVRCCRPKVRTRQWRCGR